jgi:cysteine desulfurase
MDKLYLDHAATTPPSKVALKAFQNAAEHQYANPGSLHQAGADASRLIESSRRKILNLLGANKYDLIFTATGTESNHLGIQGYFSPGLCLVGEIEHPASIEAARDASKNNFSLIPVTATGQIDLIKFKELLTSKVSMISIQWVNNELGCLQPLEKLLALANTYAPKAHFHVDAIQAAGKVAMHLDSLNIDSVAIAAHKFGGIRGGAALLCNKHSGLPKPYFTGGGHEKGVRSGTENTMAIAAMAAALEEKCIALTANPEALHCSRQLLLTKIKEKCEVILLGPEAEAETSGAILTLAIPGIRAETFLHYLESKNIYIGSGSACHAHGHTESATLKAIKLKKDLHNSVIRLSISEAICKEEIERVASAIAEASSYFKKNN